MYKKLFQCKIQTIAVSRTTCQIISANAGFEPRPYPEEYIQEVVFFSSYLFGKLVYGGFVPLYSCLRTLSEWYRSQDCDIDSTTTTSGPVQYEAVFHSCGTSPVGRMGINL